MLSLLKEEKKVVGTKQAERALLSDQVKLVYIARDADSHVVNKLVDICKSKNIEVIYVNTMEELGKACEIDVNAASVALLK
ncbi:ribosomal L7Ae/L30e/S12e/Gadd45 family protein [Clostridiaceae bacterium M8S5]|nr:ribosomal L7Ae/L30e/S12e/Gadd45 family protein [Clostridiaceae bacterium M8S5]